MREFSNAEATALIMNGFNRESADFNLLFNDPDLDWAKEELRILGVQDDLTSRQTSAHEATMNDVDDNIFPTLETR